MFGMMTLQREPLDRNKVLYLVGMLDVLGTGEDELSYLAQRVRIGVERRTLPDDIIDHMAGLDINSIKTMLVRMQNARSVYDTPRQLVMVLATRSPFAKKAARSLNF